MRQMFGTSFLTIYGDTPNRLWSERIEELTNEQCRAGLNAIAKSKHEYPVNLTEFVEACNPKTHVRYLGSNPTTPGQMRRIAPARASVATAEAAIARIRANLGAVTKLYASERSERPACTCKATGECDVCHLIRRAEGKE